MLCLIIGDVFMRYVLNQPIYGAGDLLTLTLVAIVAISIPFGGRTAAHIEIEVLEPLMSTGFKRWSQVGLRLLAAMLVFVVVWRLYLGGSKVDLYGEATQQLLISFEWAYYGMAFFFGLYGVVLVLDALRLTIFGRVDLIEFSTDELILKDE